MKCQLMWSVCMLVGFAAAQPTPVQSCQDSSKDTQCLMDYIAHQRAPETHLLQQIYGETRAISERLRSTSLECPGDESTPSAPQVVADSPKLPRDCRDIKRLGYTVSDVYTIYPFLINESLNVSCDLYEDGGGWIVFQRRRDGSVNFNRQWDDYKNGFGGPAIHEELWLGNKYLHAITEYNTQELRVDLGAWDGSRAFAKYTRFHVSTEETNFTLYLGAYSGNAGDSFTYPHIRQFSTSDRDNDAHSGSDCASSHSGGHWYGKCGFNNLNGPYRHNSTIAGRNFGITWHDWKGDRYSLKFTEMKMRPLTYTSP